MTKTEFEQIIKNNNLSENELRLLEPYKVRHAVIMAAGLGTRLRPFTYVTPKPLMKVNGIRIIDTIIDALKANDIHEIYIIRGYQAKQFDALYEKYPDLYMLNNLSYDQGNNILSACLAGNLLADAYVMPADIYIQNADVFPKYQYASNVLGYPVEKTDDWCVETDDAGMICRLAPGGRNCFKDTGIFFWNHADGMRLSRDLMKVCADKKNWQQYWSSVAFESYQGHYHSYIRVCGSDDVIEIDTLEELQEMDTSYREAML